MDQGRLVALERGLTSTLLSWGVASTILGSALWLVGWRSARPEVLRFGRQTAFWGATDAAIALAGIRSRKRRGDLDPADVETKARRLQITLIVNGLADVAYVAGGARVLSRTTRGAPASHERTPSRRGRTYVGMGRGDGAAIMIQGAFLLALDAAYALRLTRARH